MARKVTQEKNRPQKRYSIPHGYDVEFSVMDDVLDYMITCPKCNKRIMDVSRLPKRPIKLKHKCPHCNNIVVTPLVATAKDKLGIMAADIK